MGLRDWFLGASAAEQPPAILPTPDAPAAAPEGPTLRQAKSSFSWLKIVPQPADARIAAVLEIDSAAAYPYWIKLLEVKQADLDQYWIETAYQCIKLDAQAAIVDTKFDPRIANRSSEIRFSCADEWALSKFPAGRGLDLATKGKEARRHYVRIRGRMPF
jgi:hypothetical protein